MVLKTLLALLFLLNTIPVFGINNYELIVVKKIKTGTKENELGYRKVDLPGYVSARPTWFTITDNKLIYICDFGNKGIKIFDINFNYKSIITDRDNRLIHLYDHFKVDNKGNIVGYHPYLYLLKIDKNGNIIFKLNVTHYMSTVSGARNYYTIDDYLFYYNNLRKLYCVLPSGKEADDNTTNEIFAEILDKDKGVLLNDKELNVNIKTFLKEKKLLFSNDRLYINDSYLYEQYFDLIRTNIKSINLKDRLIINKTDAMKSLLGFDTHNNSYWRGDKQNTDGTITVFSKYGEVLDCFLIQYSSDPPGVIAPNGDVYCWDNGDKDYVTFYKTKNVWDSIDTPDTITMQPAIPQVTTLTATSYNTYKNMYHPIKAFDGDIKTAWLEATKGPGIGESITLELDSEITVDSIQVLPGLFDAKWWKSNNRVKALIIK